MPRVTLLTTGLAVGGAEHQVVLLAKSLLRKGWRVEIVSMLPPSAFLETLAEDSIPVLSLDMRPGVPDPRAALRLVRHLKTSRPHVLHCHMVHANLLGRLVRPLLSIPVVISTAHSIQEGGRWRDLAYRATDPLCDLVTQVSQAGARRYREERISATEKTIWLPNGVDLTRYRQDAAERSQARLELGWDGSFVWIAVGNLREPKDYPTLLGAFAKLRSERHDARLVIAGDGPLQQQLTNLARSLSIDGSVQWLGLRADVPRLMAASDAYVISSAWEGTPMALLEAAACGLPVVATAVGGNGDVIEDGRSGRLVPPRNAARLAEAMTAVTNLPDSRRLEFGLAARARVEKHYGLEAVVAKWDNVYRQLLSVKAAESRQAASFFPIKLRS